MLGTILEYLRYDVCSPFRLCLISNGVILDDGVLNGILDTSGAMVEILKGQLGDQAKEGQEWEVVAESCHNGEEEQVEISVTEGSGKHHEAESRSKRSRRAE
ncbi:hypothetical protein Tco_1005097 [Tanacetum coccineum]|uniref:Uncharacterized protein n=1 Tax=Tanacetum coccineum TaxID=301880 RepID=A0ABQ5FET7_9ASTR